MPEEGHVCIERAHIAAAAWSMAQAVRPGMGTTPTHLSHPSRPRVPSFLSPPGRSDYGHCRFLHGHARYTRDLPHARATRAEPPDPIGATTGGGGGWGRSGGEGWGDDGLAPRAVRCQWRCAQRSAGRHTAVTVNGRPRDHDQPAGRGQSAPGREGIWDAGSQQERC